MIVHVAGRQTGKTTKMIAWLLEGHPINDYPGWSRAIVCATHEMVVHVTHEVREATRIWEGTFPHHSLADLRKAIWSVEDLQYLSRGIKLDDFEYAVDNAEIVLARALRVYQSPTIITMTGELDA